MIFLRILRFPNLLIVILTQYLLQYVVLVPSFEAAGIAPLLGTWHYFLFVLSTLIIAAGGYIINDIVDLKIDLINKPERIWINRYLPLQQAWRLYYSISFIGFLISLYLALYIDNLPLVIIYPIAVALLYWYSFQLKKTVLIGNIVVAIFCAFVALIVLFAERAGYAILQEKAPKLATYCWNLFAFYGSFAFLSTLFREIIKDIEDIEGDLAQTCRTLPIVVGVKWAKIIASIVALILLALLLLLVLFHLAEKQYFLLVFNILGIELPLIFSLIYLAKKSLQKEDYHRLSSLAKLIMLLGLIYLVIGMLL